MEAATIIKYRIVCGNCGEEGVLVEKESYEIPEGGASGDCGEDLTIYFYEFKIESGNFEVIHNDIHQYEHEVVCKKCGSKEINKERLPGSV